MTGRWLRFVEDVRYCISAAEGSLKLESEKGNCQVGKGEVVEM